MIRVKCVIALLSESFRNCTETAVNEINDKNARISSKNQFIVRSAQLCWYWDYIFCVGTLYFKFNSFDYFNISGTIFSLG